MISVRMHAKDLIILAEKLGFVSAGRQIEPTDSQIDVSLRNGHVVINISSSWCHKDESVMGFRLRTNKGGYADLSGDNEEKITGLRKYDTHHNSIIINDKNAEKTIKKVLAVKPVPITKRGQTPKKEAPKPSEFTEEFTVCKNNIINNAIIKEATFLGVYSIDMKTLQVKDAMTPGDKAWFLIQFERWGSNGNLLTNYMLTDGDEYHKVRQVYYPTKEAYIPKITTYTWVLSKGDIRIIKHLITHQE